jgi:hypothetical protein
MSAARQSPLVRLARAAPRKVSIPDTTLRRGVASVTTCSYTRKGAGDRPALIPSRIASTTAA